MHGASAFLVYLTACACVCACVFCAPLRALVFVCERVRENTAVAVHFVRFRQFAVSQPDKRPPLHPRRRDPLTVTRVLIVFETLQPQFHASRLCGF